MSEKMYEPVNVFDVENTEGSPAEIEKKLERSELYTGEEVDVELKKEE